MKTPQSNVMINQFSHVAWVDGLEKKKKTFIRYTLIVFNGFFSFFLLYIPIRL